MRVSHTTEFDGSFS